MYFKSNLKRNCLHFPAPAATTATAAETTTPAEAALRATAEDVHGCQKYKIL